MGFNRNLKDLKVPSCRVNFFANSDTGSQNSNLRLLAKPAQVTHSIYLPPINCLMCKAAVLLCHTSISRSSHVFVTFPVISWQ